MGGVSGVESQSSTDGTPTIASGLRPSGIIEFHNRRVELKAKRPTLLAGARRVQQFLDFSTIFIDFSWH